MEFGGNYINLMNNLLKFVLAYVITLLVASTAMIAVHCIPKEKIVEQVRESIPILESEGIYDTRYYGLVLFRLDNFTDKTMLQLAVTPEQKSIVEEAMLNYKYVSKPNFEELKAACSGEYDGMQRTEYSRYWHGYLVTLKPLLLFFSIRGIRVINYCLFLILLTVLTFLSVKKIGTYFGICLIISLFLTNFMMVPLSLQFSTCYIVSFISMILILSFPSLTKNSMRLSVFLFTIGMITSYFDFLTAPMLPLCFSIMVVFLKKGNVINPTLFTVFLVCFAYLLGYGLMWSSKWGLAYLLTGYDVLSSAFGQAQAYTISEEVMSDSLLSLIELAKNHKSGIIFSIVPIAICFAASVVYIAKLPTQLIKDHIWMIVVMLIPVLWLLVMKNHTLIHYWFTWRNLVASLLCLLLFIYRTHNVKIKNGQNSYSDSML